MGTKFTEIKFKSNKTIKKRTNMTQQRNLYIFIFVKVLF